MKLSYYDEVTPPDYEPEGFRATVLSKPQLVSTVVNMDSGEVATNFHSVKIRVKGTPSELVVNNSQQPEEMQQQQPAALTNNMSASGSEMESQPQSQQVQEESVSLLSGGGGGGGSVVCTCQNTTFDNLMLTCGECNNLQHAACYRIVFEEDVPFKIRSFSEV